MSQWEGLGNLRLAPYPIKEFKMPQDGVHTFNQGAWHYCGRCERKAKLDTELQWQFGILLCCDCYDNYPVLVGSIEQQQAVQLDTIVQNPDLKPNEKLVNPTIEVEDSDILL
jgi:hypothetical protein